MMMNVLQIAKRLLYIFLISLLDLSKYEMKFQDNIFNKIK